MQGPIPSHSAAAADYGAILADAETDELVDQLRDREPAFFRLPRRLRGRT